MPNSHWAQHDKLFWVCPREKKITDIKKNEGSEREEVD